MQTQWPLAKMIPVMSMSDPDLTMDMSSNRSFRDDDEEDETAELMRELEKIKRERAEQRAREVSSACGQCCATE